MKEECTNYIGLYDRNKKDRKKHQSKTIIIEFLMVALVVFMKSIQQRQKDIDKVSQYS